MHIRTLDHSDLNALLALYAYLHAEDVPLPDQQTVDNTWSEILHNERIRYFGCIVGDELVSTCTIAIIPNLTRGCRSYGVIENVVTHPHHRKHGYGHAVLKHALDHAWNHHCYKVMLLTGHKDEAILNFYKSTGFNADEKQAFIAKPGMQKTRISSQ
ncbi:MAG: GNAT family N-acetyltransferase [Steroidobacter sp.]